jgi:hypothetical protein
MGQPTEKQIECARAGVAALLPGMTYMLTMMQKQVDAMKAILEDAPAPEEQQTVRDVLGEPILQTAARPRPSGWPADPKARKAEAARRRAVRLERAGKVVPVKAPGHPRELNHPGHAKWLVTMRTANKANWDRMTKAQRKARIAKALAGRGIKAA